MSTEPVVHPCFESQTGTWQYVVADPATNTAVIIDSVLDFDPAKNTISTTSADALLSLVQEKGFTVDRLLETHAHADHLTAAKYLQSQLETRQGTRPQVCIGKRIAQVQERFASKYGIQQEDCAGMFDKLFDDDEEFSVGQLTAKILHLPGHTPDHIGYVIGSNVFCGDSLFNADVGSARCDFPDGDANALYQSVRKLLALPADFKIWTGHDYPPGGDGRAQPLAYMTVGEQNNKNKHLKQGVAEMEFVSWRKERDSALAAPRLIDQALQFNIRAGQLPRATAGGDRLLHVPIKMQGQAW